jgi:hypothetical protein
MGRRSRSARCAAVAVALQVLFVICGSSAAQTLRINNSMDSGVWLWMKSEAKKDWSRWFIARNEFKDVTLVSPDRYQVVVDDRQRARHSAGLLALRAMLADDPSGVLEIGGIMETKAETYYGYSERERRWVLRQRQRKIRVAVTFTLYVNGKQVKYVEVP